MAFRMSKSPLVRLSILLLLAVLDGTRATRFCETVVEPLGYGCSEYSVQTDDGFVLVMHRLSIADSMSRKGHNSHHESDHQPADSRNKVVGTGSDLGSDSASRSGEGHSTSDRILRCNDGTTQGAISGASAHPAYPHIPATFGCENIDPRAHNSDSPHGPVAEKVQPILSSDPTPAPDTVSVSLSRAKEDPSVGPAPSSIHDASWTSAPQPTVNGGTSSNYTPSPEAGKGSPVLLMHMEFFSGDIWFKEVDADRHVSHLLPLMLVEDGFDVWIGHQRATYWGHGHARLQPTDRAYWDWTWDQHVQYDLPAQLRFISTETNRHVHFVGASQAATVGAAAATGKDTAKMIRSLTLIGPTAFRGNSNSALLNAWAYVFGVSLDTDIQTYYTTGFHNGAFNFTSEFPRTGPISGQGLSGMTIDLISGPNCCLGSTSIQMTNGWDGTTSFKNLLHWQQGIRSNHFQQFDYGTAAGNLRAYGQPTPPAYNAADIPSKLPILIIGGGTDWYAPPQGTNNLMSQLQKPATLVNLTNYAHFDLYFSAHRESDIYIPILQFLEGPEFK